MERIYCVVTLLFSDDDLLKHKRAWGWFPTFEEAEKCIMENHCDIYESGTYNMALIEEVEPYISFDTKEYWYSVEYIDQNEYIVKSTNKPGKYKNVVCFSLG